MFNARDEMSWVELSWVPQRAEVRRHRQNEEQKDDFDLHFTGRHSLHTQESNDDDDSLSQIGSRAEGNNCRFQNLSTAVDNANEETYRESLRIEKMK